MRRAIRHGLRPFVIVGGWLWHRASWPLRILRQRRARRRAADQVAAQVIQRGLYERTAWEALSAASQMADRERELLARTPLAAQRMRYINDSAARGLLRVVMHTRRRP